MDSFSKFLGKVIMTKTIDPNKIKVGDVILVATNTKITIEIQQKLGYGESSKWTHVAGSIGGYDRMPTIFHQNQ